MKLPLLIILLFTSTFAWAKDQAYLDTEDNQIVSVFNKPGMNWKTCPKDSQCQPVAWPDNKAKIKILSPRKKMKVVDPYTGQLQNEEFVLIEYSYKREANGKVWEKAGQGWIDASYLSQEKHTTFYGDDCPPQQKDLCAKKDGFSELVEAINPVERVTGNQSVKEIAQSLSGVIGKCVLKPTSSAPRLPAGNPFDTLVLPTLEKSRSSKLVGPDGKALTLQQLANIDALARTIYGEMMGCYKKGLQYPMAIAKIALNRSNAPEKTKKAFIGQDKDHSSKKEDLARVLTTPTQFNVWMKSHNKKPNGSLTKALCPPSDPKKPSWQGFPPGADEQAIWENTLRIATEAVLYPTKFSKRTAEVKETYYDYNSGPANPWGYKRVFPKIEGRKVDNVACMQVWKR